MKFKCYCGYIFVDQTDDLFFKASIYPDQSMEALFDAIDTIFKVSEPADILEKDKLIHPIIFPNGNRLIYQCPDCGRLHLTDGNGEFCTFKPESESYSKELFKIDENET